MTVVYVPSVKGEVELTRTIGGPVGRDLRQRGEKLVVLARNQVGKETGLLASSITSVIHADAVGLYALVGSSDPIALLHHTGTRPHQIRANRGGVLRFSSHGRVYYARRVFHPGTKPNPYLTSNLIRVVK